MSHAKEMMLFADLDAEEAAWRSSPEYRTLLAERRCEEAVAAAEKAGRERDLACEHPHEWREWLRVRPLLPELIDLWAERPFDFGEFLNEVGTPPSPDHVVARKDESKPLERGNMHWTGPHGVAATLPPPRLDGKCYTTKEFAVLVNKAAYTVRQMCLRGIIKAEREHRAGRTGEWRIPPAELVRWQQDGPFKLPRTRS